MSGSFRVGQWVRVVEIIEEDLAKDPKSHRPVMGEEWTKKALRCVGRVGMVRQLTTNGGAAESEGDPLYTVSIPHVGRMEFWSEELTLSRKPRSKT